MTHIFETVKMWWNGKDTEVSLGFTPSTAFNNDIRFIKTRADFHCSYCKNDFNKRVTSVGGRGMPKLCFKCGKILMDNMLKDMEEIKEQIKEELQEFERNKIKWEKSYILSIIDTDNKHKQ